MGRDGSGLLAAPFILEACVAMFHFNGQVRFNAGYRRQDMIQDLLCRHPERSAARALTFNQPALSR